MLAPLLLPLRMGGIILDMAISSTCTLTSAELPTPEPVSLKAPAGEDSRVCVVGRFQGFQGFQAKVWDGKREQVGWASRWGV